VHQSFVKAGAGHRQALFESIELDQKRGGVI
jgi:hypothetical protein